MRNIKSKIILFSIICLLLVANNATILSKEESLDDKNSEIIIRISSDASQHEEHLFEMSRQQADQIIMQIQLLQENLEDQEITEVEYIKGFIDIFQKQHLLPKECSFENLFSLAQEFQVKSPSLYLPLNNTNETGDEKPTIPLHIGRSTIIASIGIGNYLVQRIIPFRPFGFHEVFTNDLLTDYNLTSMFSYASACIWTPGPKGHHVLYSLKPYPALERFSQKIFADKAIGGIFFLGVNISLEAYAKDGSEVLFDATIGIYGSDIMFGFSK